MYEQQLAAWQRQVEQALQRLTPEVLQPDSVVAKAAAYSLLGGGKRVRGVLTLASAALVGGEAARAESYAAAVEMLHAYSLIHDDLPCMDDDDFRRGRPSCHKAFGEATALLAGDALLTAAFETLCKNDLTAAQNAEAVAQLAAAAGSRGMVYGQELDLAAEQCPADEAGLLHIHENKTGRMIGTACALGALCAGADTARRDALQAYAADLGMVFQIVDDILDVTSDDATLGKPVGSDRESGKTTFVTLFGLQGAEARAQQLTGRACDALRTQFGDRADFLCWFAGRLLRRTA